MSKPSLFIRSIVALGCVGCLLLPTPAPAQEEPAQEDSASLSLYNPGTPSMRDVWVDPVHGNDSNDGATPATAFRSLNAAWDTIPMNTTLTEGVRVNLQPGNYDEGTIPIYWESRHGTFTAPIWIRGNGTSRADVILLDDFNIYDTRYIYFENFTTNVNGDVFHCELCDHVLIRNVTFNGNGAAQETIKVNQSQYFYVENSNLSGAYENVIDYVAVQYGHILKNQIHGGGDWCAYVKGGSAYIRVEANVIYDCGTGGFSAGQGTGFQYMTPPWLQYEAYDVKVVNNVIHDTEGAGLGVNGGYNILMAYNTLYRVGSRSHLVEVVYGLRSCDRLAGDPIPPKCQEYLDQGGWGTTTVADGTNAINIPDKNVYIFNNVIYNPPGFQSAWMHFAIYDAQTNPASSNIPNATTDGNLQIRGNVIWNGDASMPLGVEDSLDACIASDPTCNETQLRADNAINTIQPAFVNAAGGDFHIAGSWASGATLFPIPDYVWELTVPSGTTSNAVPTDKGGASRAGQDAPGAYIVSAGSGTLTATFRSAGAQDGYVLEATETSKTGGSMNASATVFNLGDAAADKEYRAILHFDLNLPANAVITKVTLKIRRQGLAGNDPFASLGKILVDIRSGAFSNNNALQTTDFQAAAHKNAAGSIQNRPVSNWYSVVFPSSAFSYINKSGVTQFRLRFQMDDNDNGTADYLKFYSGNAGTASRPQLIVEYHTP